MKIKKGASLQGLNIQMRNALIHANLLWKTNGQELVITSGTDGEHSAGSLHYYGLAVDLRTHYFDEVTKNKLASKLDIILGRNYKVINEATHIHVEYAGDWSKC